MAEEFLQGGVCWWSSPSPRSIFSSTPCSNDVGSFGWPANDVNSTVTEMKSVRSSDDSGCSASDGSSSLIPHDHHGSMPLQMIATPEGWNQDLIRDSENYSDFLLDTSINYSKNFSEDSTMSTVKQGGYGGEQQQLLDNSLSSPASYSYASSLLQTLFDTDSQPPLHTNGFLPMMKQQPWNATSAPLADVRPTNFVPSPPSRFLPSSLTNHSIGAKQHEQVKDLTTAAKKASNEPPAKRPRFETPSSLPTFKVRKEKLGDRITALQQLVSPFGKTDTASVLHEAIEYIRFLHDQVNALSTPYLKYGSPPVAQGTDKRKGEDGLKKDLKTRGLCLVPISSTFPVASETTADFWTPTFGGSFR